MAAASTGASTEQGRRLQQCMAAVCQALLAAKAELDDLDAKVSMMCPLCLHFACYSASN